MPLPASNMLFDIFNTHILGRILHILALSEAVPHLFGEFSRVKIFHSFSEQEKILTSLARFLQGDDIVLILTLY